MKEKLNANLKLAPRLGAGEASFSTDKKKKKEAKKKTKQFNYKRK